MEETAPLQQEQKEELEEVEGTVSEEMELAKDLDLPVFSDADDCALKSDLEEFL